MHFSNLAKKRALNQLLFSFQENMHMDYLREKKAFNPFANGNRIAASVFETAGQFTYVYAMAGNASVAAPMVASYCAVAVLLSRITLREKLRPMQYAAIAIIFAGIVLFGISEGLAG